MSVSGLSRKDQKFARQVVGAACKELLAHPADVHYTQGPNRWDGITHGKTVHGPGLYPYYGDCSSTATWMLWRALHVPFDVPDIVNGANWRAGYTGTLLAHGYQLKHEYNARLGDLALYGRPGSTGSHVAVCLGDGTVFSHGSEGGPYRLPVRYRGDLICIRRYI